MNKILKKEKNCINFWRLHMFINVMLSLVVNSRRISRKLSFSSGFQIIIFDNEHGIFKVFWQKFHSKYIGAKFGSYLIMAEYIKRLIWFLHIHSDDWYIEYVKFTLYISPCITMNLRKVNPVKT